MNMYDIELDKEALRFTEEKLFAQYGKVAIDLKQACNDFLCFNTEETIANKIKDNALPFPVIHDKSNSRYAPKLVSISDLARYIECQRKEAIAKFNLR